MGQVDDVRQCVTMDLKEPGNLIYLVGVTHNELGGSHSDMARRTFAGLHAAIRAGAVRACHDLSEGGLAVALAEMAFAGGWGARVSLDAVPHAVSPGDTPSLETILLFAESNSRFLCEVAPASQQEFEQRLSGVPHALIGQVTAEAELTILSAADGEQRIVVAADVPVLKEAWQKPLRW
jgi:phosphoribosylformylglycinamidine synthase subunit PurSL